MKQGFFIMMYKILCAEGSQIHTLGSFSLGVFCGSLAMLVSLWGWLELCEYAGI
jgi:hypothetical protein